MGKKYTFAPVGKMPYAEIAQLVEHNLAKVGVAGPSPVFRSFFVFGVLLFVCRLKHNALFVLFSLN